MAKLDDLEFRITASTDLLRTQVAQGTQVVQKFADDTGRSFNELHNRFTEVAGKIRSVFALFGVGFGTRVFEDWIAGATNVNKLTAEQYEKLSGVKTAIADLKTATDDLAQTIALKLAPAIETAAKFWREFLFPTQGEAADARIGQINTELATLSKQAEQFASQRGGAGDNFLTKLLGTDPTSELNSVIEQMRKLEAERAKLTGTTDKSKDLLFGNLEGFEVGTSSTENGLPAEIKKFPTFDPAAIDQASIDLEKQMADFVNNAKLPAFKFPKIDLEDFDDGLKEAQKQAKQFADSVVASFESRGIQALLDGDLSGAIKGLAQDFAELVLKLTVLKPLAESFSSWFTASGGLGALFGGIGAASGAGSAVPAVPGASFLSAPGRAQAASAGPTVNQYFYNQVGLPPQWAAQNIEVGKMAASAAAAAVSNKLNGKR